MADPTAAVTLTRPGPALDRGPLDDELYDLVEARFRRVVRDNPVTGTFLGIHGSDELLGDGSRDAVLAELDAERRHLAAVEAVDPAGLSDDARFERDLEIHNLRRAIFSTDVVRTWERRSTALDTLGDALFLLFARDFAPLAERLGSIAARLEAVPSYLEGHRTRPRGPQVRLWQHQEIDAAADLPAFLDEIEATGAEILPGPERKRLRRGALIAREAISDYAEWLTGTLAGGTDGWALGRERYDALISLRSFDGLDSDAILAIGEEQLALNRAARIAAARAIDPAADEAAVVDRIKGNHPATFEEALDAYREAMHRARRHLIDRDLVSVPADERISVIETPRYQRNVIPFAAYFEPAKFDPDPTGIYVVTRSVGEDPDAMREHNRASISNTSVHEAYPGHHLQLSVAARHPSLSRLLTDAPEFVEGWGMYCEQMMREEGFDAEPPFQLAVATDAIWRACRIVLDVRMHRGELTVEEATDYLVRHTSFQRSNAQAEVIRYTYTPTYQLSYLLGKVLLLGLREDERRRLGDRFNLRDFHDRLLGNASIPISFHRRLFAAGSRA